MIRAALDRIAARLGYVPLAERDAANRSRERMQAALDEERRVADKLLAQRLKYHAMLIAAVGGHDHEHTGDGSGDRLDLCIRNYIEKLTGYWSPAEYAESRKALIAEVERLKGEKAALQAERDAASRYAADMRANAYKVEREALERVYPCDAVQAAEWQRMHTEAAAEAMSLRDEVAKLRGMHAEIVGKLTETIQAHTQARVERDDTARELRMLKLDWDAEIEGNLALRERFGARDDETWPAFVERLVKERDEAQANYHAMVERAADEKLDGYRELGGRAWRRSDPETRGVPQADIDAFSRLCAAENRLKQIERIHADDMADLSAQRDEAVAVAMDLVAWIEPRGAPHGHERPHIWSDGSVCSWCPIADRARALIAKVKP